MSFILWCSFKINRNIDLQYKYFYTYACPPIFVTFIWVLRLNKSTSNVESAMPYNLREMTDDTSRSIKSKPISIFHKWLIVLWKWWINISNLKMQINSCNFFDFLKTYFPKIHYINLLNSNPTSAYQKSIKWSVMASIDVDIWLLIWPTFWPTCMNFPIVRSLSWPSMHWLAHLEMKKF